VGHGLSRVLWRIRYVGFAFGDEGVELRVLEGYGWKSGIGYGALTDETT
jgi:hypothetical protein